MNSSSSNKPKVAASKSTTKSDKAADKSKKKLHCNYCKASDLLFKDYPKLKQKEAKKKEAGMVVVDASPSNSESANMVQDIEWAFNVHCSYNPSVHDACMSVADSQVWYFDSGATHTKHITSQRDIFSFLESAPTGNTVTCADNSMYPVKGGGWFYCAECCKWKCFHT